MKFILKDGFVDTHNEKQYDYLIEIKNLQINTKDFYADLQKYLYSLDFEYEVTYYLEIYFKEKNITDYTIDYLYNLDTLYY